MAKAPSPKKQAKARKQPEPAPPTSSPREPRFRDELVPATALGKRSLLGILALALLLRSLNLLGMLPVLVDESIYLRWAEIIDNQGQWFISLLDGKQPLHPWVLAVQRMVWDGDPLLGGRFLSAIAGLLSTIGIFAIGRRVSSELGGIIAAFLYAIFPLAMLYDRLAYTEGFVNACGIFLALTSIWIFAERPSLRSAWIPGAAMAIAMLTKQTLLLLWFFPALAALLYRRERASLAPLAFIYGCGVAAVVFCAVMTPEAPMLSTHDAVLHHTGFFASPEELLADPFGPFAINIAKLGGYLTTYLTWPGLLACIAAIGYLAWRKSLAAWAILSLTFAPWLVQLFLLKLMYPTRYPYPHFWPLLVVMAMAAVDLWDRSPAQRRKPILAGALALVALPMLYRDFGLLFNTREHLHERDQYFFTRSVGHVGYGIAEAIDFLEGEAQRNGGFVLLTDPIWGPPSDVMAPYLNGKFGIRVFECWWTQLSGTHPIMPFGAAELIKSHYERTQSGRIDFRQVDRVFYITDTEYNPPEAVHVRQPTAQLAKRFPKPENDQSIDVYRLK